jgi:hypothetical protein
MVIVKISQTWKQEGITIVVVKITLVYKKNLWRELNYLSLWNNQLFAF